MKKKIVTVLGARPQFVKASVVSRILTEQAQLHEIVVHTGQHFDANMSDVFFDELGMAKPAYQLGIHGGPHGEMTGRMLQSIEQVLASERPDAVLVYGDTNSTLAGALAAAKMHIPVAHVEAGLRSFNMGMPEEINRILTDRISTWLYAPTATAVAHLCAEGVAPEKILQVGDVMFDLARVHGARLGAHEGLLKELGLGERDFALVTVHRAENTDDPRRLAAIVSALKQCAATLRIVWPLHPRTRSILQNMGELDALADKLCLLEPLGYFEMLQLEKYAALIATDSGGVQKEAFFHGVPCVTLREETEWVELVDSGWNRLVPPLSAPAIVETMLAALHSRGRSVAPYGDGHAAERIVAHLAEVLAA